MNALHDYQARVINWMMDRDYGYLAIDMGLGKTRCILEYLKRTGEKAVVFAPLQVILSTWPSEIKKWTPELTYKVLHGPDKAFRKDMSADLYLINYDGIKWFTTHCLHIVKEKRVLVLDESTAVKNRTSMRSGLLRKLRPWFSKCFLMSGTPCPQGLWDWWSQFRIMDKGECLSAKWGIFEQYFLDYNPWTHTIQMKPGKSEELVKRIEPHVLRLSSDDYLSLPDFIENDILLELPKELEDKYRQFEQDMVYELSETKVITGATANIVSNKLRQFLQGGMYDDLRNVERIHTLKLDALMQVLEELNGTPTIVPIAYKFELEFLREKLRGRFKAITGATPVSERNGILNEWNAGKLLILVVHPASISHGVNLQAGGHYITWLGLTWSLEQYAQVNGRLRRQGQPYPVVLNRILFRGTKDETVAKVLARKGATQDAVLKALQS